MGAEKWLLGCELVDILNRLHHRHIYLEVLLGSFRSVESGRTFTASESTVFRNYFVTVVN